MHSLIAKIFSEYHLKDYSWGRLCCLVAEVYEMKFPCYSIQDCQFHQVFQDGILSLAKFRIILLVNIFLVGLVSFISRKGDESSASPFVFVLCYNVFPLVYLQIKAF